LDWETLLDQYGAALLLYARQWTASHQEAEEAVQEGFVKVWRARPNGPDQPAPLLYRAVKQSAIDLARKRVRRRQREKAAGALETGEPVAMFESGFESKERRDQIERALAKLPAEQREVVVMKIWGELTFRQIAETLDVSANTAASRYRYALRTLRKELATAGAAR